MNPAEKVIWITGASSGIGKALALALAERGARLILTARRVESLDDVSRQTGLGADRVRTLPADLSETNEIAGLVTRAVALFGHVDILINNAGVSQRATAAETDDRIMRQILEIDFFAPAILSRHLLPFLHERPESGIVVISSIAGKFGTQLRSAYSAAKHALHGYFESLRLEEWQKNVHVLLVVAGYVRTNISLNAFGADGTAHQVMDPGLAAGISPEKAAEAIIRAMEKDRMETTVGIDRRTGLGLLLKSVWPALLARLLRRSRVT